MTVTATPEPLTQDALSSLMREGSRAEHTSAENTTFMTDLLEGRSSVEAYTVFLRQLAAVYEVLESVGRDLAGDPVAAAVVDDALMRAEAIDADLRVLAGDDWRDLPVGPAATAYAARIAETRDDAVLYLAHHYTRYLGDLSGGQAIGRILQRAYGLTDGGVSFYEFPAIAKPKIFKDAYRANLDALPFDDETKARVVAEVKVAFGLNEALFAEMSA
ncbi:heme oxygenase (biliverdin-producing) [Mumia zhuanghuii]|uniref:Biliverdin-producing heme oxygenase n=1 Tax=Mumia zhuanghuii TaxID=2585211 RepID=A0A5C4MP74_9ACTN|nr:biliverdin-producing heme oxygenase [Mumia zhuanghuii]TNC31195.1 biliverdin-producing heme oxygenase [Mumia zhuanghuii]TNC44944.1 biliverdin-producing heme oxygenase [Mumia zhuanghuii]